MDITLRPEAPADELAVEGLTVRRAENEHGRDEQCAERAHGDREGHVPLRNHAGEQQYEAGDREKDLGKG